MFFDGGGIMEGFCAYLLSVICGATVYGIVTHFFELKGTLGASIKLVAGLFLAFTVICPAVRWSSSSLNFSGILTGDGSYAVEQGKTITQQALSDIIKSRCEAYILDKAAGMDLSLTVEVGVSADEMPVPKTVRISGNISPYKKSKLKSILVNDLGIEEEDQTWT